MDQANEKKANWFLGIYDAFVQSPVRFLSFVMICVAVFFVYTQHEIITNTVLIPDPGYEAAQFSSSIDRDILINDSLEDFRMDHGAQGAVIGQYHNGQYDLTNLPFQKVTVTYYVGKLENFSDEDVFTTRPISTMARINKSMWKSTYGPTCVGYEVNDIPDVGHRSRMSQLGYSYVQLCPIENIREYPIGYVSVGYDFIPDEQTLSNLREAEQNLANRIAGYLQEGVNIGK